MKKTLTAQEVANRLDNMDLSKEFRWKITATPLNNIVELFGNLDTKEKVETFVKEYFYEDEEEGINS